MHDMNNGFIDIGYWGGDDNASAGETRWVTTTSPPGWVIGQHWRPYYPDHVPVFEQVNPTNHAVAMNNIFPYRGECQGATQICMFKAALDAIGAGRFSAVHTGEKLMVGAWRIGGAWNASANRHLRGVVDKSTIIPGDYANFENKDDYRILCPEGFWGGENCIFDGINSEGVGRFSGLDVGGNALSKDEWVNRLVKAYNRDCCSRKFADTNGNGVHDAGEPYIGNNDEGVWEILGAEPFDDDNSNGVRDEGEHFWDCNGDGVWNGATSADMAVPPNERAGVYRLCTGE